MTLAKSFADLFSAPAGVKGHTGDREYRLFPKAVQMFSCRFVQMLIRG